ncbi:MAG: hypothetical protein K6G65_04610 [Lachnospiraceae bacterium]|nr:hypothetical protein [Lachnospiraceae bacterium]
MESNQRNDAWIHNPELKKLHPKKIEIISELIENCQDKPIAQSISYLIKANARLKAAGLSFSEDETTMLMRIMSKDEKTREEMQHALDYLKKHV